MKWRAKWSHVVIALGVIAALAIASPVFGLSKSIKKAIKKEVSKQISKATGPQGPPGANGTNGTARAYGAVEVLNATGMPICSVVGNTCPVVRSKGIESAVRVPLGYCVVAPGIDARETTAAVTVEAAQTNNPEGNTSAMIDTVSTTCENSGLPGAFYVRTERQPVITVDKGGGTDNATVSGPSDDANDVSFGIVIP
jgi:hypothetical protein